MKKIVLFSLFPLTAFAKFNVTNTVPAGAAMGAALDQAVTIAFDAMVNPATVNAATFSVHGDQHGPYSGTLMTAGSQATFTPGIDYLPGERITVSP